MNNSAMLGVKRYDLCMLAGVPAAEGERECAAEDGDQHGRSDSRRYRDPGPHHDLSLSAGKVAVSATGWT